MDSEARIRSFCDELYLEITGNILPYWSGKMVDSVNGGFFGRRDGYDRVDDKADKGVILNTRILWTFSSAAKQLDEVNLILARRAYHYLVSHFVDKEFGGVYWAVDFTGSPVQTKKQIYAQAFAIYALSEYYTVTLDEEALDLAKDIFSLIERYSFDQIDNGYLEAFDREWNLLDDLRLSEKDENEKKTMNTHLHVLEAYTNLYRVWPDTVLRRQLYNLIDIFQQRILGEGYHFHLFFDEKWKVKSSEISYGHDIEGSWLLLEAAKVLGDEKPVKAIATTCLKIADVTLAEGVDQEGAIKNHSHDTDRHWWPQAEGMVGFVNSWELTGQITYLSAAIRLWEFIKNYLIDRPNGEWYWRVDDKGTVNCNEDKAGPWKCPYHNGRAILELLKRLNHSRGKRLEQ